MQAFKIHYFLFFAVLMLTAKPFVGFSALKQMHTGRPSKIFVKAFTKRKQEYVEDGDFDTTFVYKQLANPVLVLTFLSSFFLTTLFPALFRSVKQITNGLLSAINLSSLPSLDRYLLSGKLVI